MNKIKTIKLVPKLVLAILLFTLISSFMLSFVSAYGCRRPRRLTVYPFEATATLRVFVLKSIWTEDGVQHMIFYKENDLSGTINEIEFTGRTEEDFSAKTDLATGVTIVYALARLYISWGELSGQFSGPLYVRGEGGKMEGEYVLPGYEDFARSFLFGRLWVVDAATVELSGTILLLN